SGLFGIQRVPQTGDDVVIGNNNLSAALTLSLDVASVNLNTLTIGAGASGGDQIFQLNTNTVNVASTVTISPTTSADFSILDCGTGVLTVTTDLVLDGTGSGGQTAKLFVHNGNVTINGNF